MPGAREPVDAALPPLSAADRLDSWKEIATYLKRSVRTVHRWEAEQRLPVHRHLHQSAGTVYAYKSELDGWWAGRKLELEASPQEVAPSSPDAPEAAARAHGSRRTLAVTVGAAAVLVFVTVAVLVFREGLRGGAAPSGIHSLAVLPLENLTGDPSQEYLADAMTDGLITQLAQLGELRVISRTSVIQYKHTKKTLPAVAQVLNVDAVVEGTVAREGQRVRVTAQLIDARSDRHVWARSYDRDMSEVLALQGEIAQAIGERIEGKLTQGQRARFSKLRAVNVEAADLLYQGLAAASNQTVGGFGRAIQYFERAVAKQPDFAEAYAAMAICYNQFSFAGSMAPREFMPKADAAARKAIELDDGLSEGHAALGFVLYRYYWRWADAEREFRRALELSANSDTRATFYGFFAASGRAHEALKAAQRSAEVDPISMQGALDLGAAYRAVGQYDQAIARFRQMIERDITRPRPHYQLGITYVEQGDLSQAIPELEAAVKLSNGNSRYLGYLGYANVLAGNTGEARRILSRLDAIGKTRYVSPLAVASVYAALGDTESALEWLEKAYAIHDADLCAVASDRRFARLRGEPRFQALLRSVSPPAGMN